MDWRFWLELWVRSGVLLLIAEALRRLAKTQTAAFRHRLLLGAFALLAFLPVLSVLIPEIPLPLWTTAAPHAASVNVQAWSRTVAQSPVRHTLNWLLIIWVSGVVLSLIPTLAGTVSAHRIASAAAPFNPSALDQALLHPYVSTMARTTILVSNELSVPLTCGIFRKRILLPSASQSWTPTRLYAVLSHELAHIQRHDLGAQLAAHVVAALWWFQPLVWVLRRNLRTESELACDAQVMRSGFRPSQYAAELLEIAKAIRRDWRFSSSAIMMARTCDLEERLQAILNPVYAPLSRRRTYTLVLALGSTAVAASAITLRTSPIFNEGGSSMKTTISALLTSAGLSAATISGSIHDPNGAAIADAKVIVYNPDTGAKQETVTASDGRFTIEQGGGGQYILKIEKSGYASIFRGFELKPDSKRDRDFVMTNEGGPQASDTSLTSEETQERRIRVGGAVAQSNLQSKVQPIYPAAAKAAGVQGTVEIETTISKEGVPVDLRVLSSPSDDLSESALEAVRQWRYRPTLLNGEPVQILTVVVVNYTLTQ